MVCPPIFWEAKKTKTKNIESAASIGIGKRWGFCTIGNILYDAKTTDFRTMDLLGRALG